jgi:hypothetical protein
MDQLSRPVLDKFCSSECDRLGANLVKAWEDESCRSVTVGGVYGKNAQITIPLERNSTCLKSQNNGNYCVLEIKENLQVGNRFDKVGVTAPKLVCTYCYSNWLKARVSPNSSVNLNGVQMEPVGYNKICSGVASLSIPVVAVALSLLL